jgi:hypothetical protein
MVTAFVDKTNTHRSRNDVDVHASQAKLLRLGGECTRRLGSGVLPTGIGTVAKQANGLTEHVEYVVEFHLNLMSQSSYPPRSRRSHVNPPGTSYRDALLSISSKSLKSNKTRTPLVTAKDRLREDHNLQALQRHFYRAPNYGNIPSKLPSPQPSSNSINHYNAKSIGNDNRRSHNPNSRTPLSASKQR